MDLSVRPVPYGYKSTPFFKIITKRFGVGQRTLSSIKFSTSDNNTYRFKHLSQGNETSFSIFDGYGHWNGPNAKGLDNIILLKQEKGYLTTPFFG